jgi:hydroxymethylpyrimidine/phosphomethylpyrimidine kinase
MRVSLISANPRRSSSSMDPRDRLGARYTVTASPMGDSAAISAAITADAAAQAPPQAQIDNAIARRARMINTAIRSWR